MPLPLLRRFLIAIALTATATLHAQSPKGSYSTAKEAYDIGLTLLANNNFAKAQEALEEALKLNPDDGLKNRIYQALVRPYRNQPDLDKFCDALEYIARNAATPAERSLARSSMIGGAQQKGKAKELAKRYEDALQKKPDDEVSLYFLGGVYATIQPDPKRSAALLEKYLAATAKKNGDKVDVDTSAQLAEQYVKGSRFTEGAELFEKIAPADATRKAWHLKEAATAWAKAKEPAKAIAAAKASAESKEERTKILTHFWHRALGEVFLNNGEPKLAVEQFEKAIQTTDIDGYKKDCQKLLDAAKAKQ